MTDPTTPLTDESEALLEHIESLNGRSFPLATREDFARIEQAAARRAIEGSGVVEALMMVTDALDVWVEGSHRVTGGRCPHRDDGPCTSHRVVAEARRILAALSRDPVQGSGAPTNLPAPADRGGPEEPRVERCAVCGVGRWVTAHDPEAGPSHHPFTPEAR